MSTLHTPHEEPEAIGRSSPSSVASTETVRVESPTLSRQRPTVGKKTIRVLASLGTAGLAVIIGTWYAVGFAGAPSAQAEELRRLRADGVPLTPADLRRLPIAPEANAAPIYRAIFSRIDGNGDLAPVFKILDRDAGHVYGQTAPPEELREVDAALERATPVFDRTQAASQLSLDYEREWEKGAALLLPEYASEKALVKALSLRAVRRSDRGDFTGAFDDLRTAALVTRAHGGEPTLIGALVQIANEAIIGRAVGAVVTRNPHQPGLAANIRELVTTFGPPANMRRALGGEVVMDLVTLDQIRREPSSLRSLFGGAGDGPTDLLLTAVLAVPGGVDVLGSHVLRQQRLLYEALPADPNDVTLVRRATASADQRLSESQGWQDTLASVFSPTYSGAGDAIAKQIAGRRILLTMADRLEGKATAQIDPFNGEPLHVKPIPGGLVIYSVGTNGKDDGGERASDDSSKRDDVSVSFPPPSSRSAKWKPNAVRDEGHATGWVVR